MDKDRAKKLETATEYKRSGLGRHDLNPDQRAKLLGEQKKEEKAQEEQPKRNPFKDRGQSLLERINARTAGFTKGGVITESGEEKQTELVKEVKESNASLLEKAALKTKDLGKQSSRHLRMIKLTPFYFFSSRNIVFRGF